MARSSWVSPLEPFQIGDGTAYNTSVTLTDVSAAPNHLLAANQLTVGTMIELNAFGKFSNTATPTLLLGFYYGAVAGTALVATSAITTTTGATNWQFSMYYRGIVRSNGATGTIMGAGWIDLATSLTAFTHRPLPETAVATVTIDTTTSKALTVGAQWGTSSASNTLTCSYFDVQISN